MQDFPTQMDFDVGLVQVSVQHDPEPPQSLPTQEPILPSSRQFALQLNEVLYAPASQEQRLLEALQPQITHQEILKPWIFNDMTRQALTWLQSRAQDAGQLEERRKLRRAMRTLEEFDALSVLLKRFQHALHRG